MLSALRFLPFLILLLLPDVSEAAKAKAQSVCVNAKGEILIKNKCKKNEKKFSLDILTQGITQNLNIVGIKGSPGITGPTGAVGPQGPAGSPGAAGIKGQKALIDFSGCRQVSSGTRLNINQAFMTISEASATATCNPNAEFIFSDSFKQQPFGNSGTRAVIKTRSTLDNTIAGDQREYEVTYYAERVTTVGNGQFTFEVNAICCPR